MNETIGEKGGHNDRIRRFRIVKARKKKEEQEEIKKLEKEVRKKQKFVFIKTIPIVIAGGTLKALYEVAKGKRNVSRESNFVIEDNVSEEVNEPYTFEDEYIVVDKDNGEKIKVRKKKLKKNKKVIVDEQDENFVEVIVKEDKTDIHEEKVVEKNKGEKKAEKESNNIESEYQDVEEKYKNIDEYQDIEEYQNIDEYQDIEEVEVAINEGDIDFDSLTPSLKEKLEKLKSHKIVDEYEKNLKDIRYDLRRLVFDYNAIVAEEERMVFLDEAEEILDRLTKVIERLEELKERIKIDDLDKYDDNYIYTLIEDYLKEFGRGQFVREIKDSPLYVLIAEKIDELEDKSGELNNKINLKKEKMKVREERFKELKNSYLDFERINDELIKFQNEQDFLLQDVQERIKNAVTVSEKVKVELEAMSLQSTRLLGLLAMSMFIPGNKASKTLTSSMAAYLYFVNQLMHPKTVTKKYRVIQVDDLSGEIEDSMEAVMDADRLLKKTDAQIDKVIAEIMTKYKDYLNESRECQELLANLERMKENIHEKEYEMMRIKEDQELLLEENQAKVLQRGEYPM